MQLQQSLSRSEAPLLCNGWGHQQQSMYICKSFFHKEACHEVKKEVCLVDRVGCRHVKFWARNVSRRGKIDLPDSLLEEPLLDNIFRHFCSFYQFFDCRDAFPVALGAVVDFGEFGVHFYKAEKVQRKRKGAYPSASAPPPTKRSSPCFCSSLG